MAPVPGFSYNPENWKRFAPRKWIWPLLVGLAAFAGSAAVSFWIQMPQPSLQDEFSYLLAADTFSAGRLTNPEHPLWIFFETLQVNSHPTYCSKYFPGQGLLLAAGQAIAREPVFGVWLGIGLACAAICWALEAWLPVRWAVLGGILAVFKIGIFSYWSQSYLCAALPALGGALVFGAFRRIVDGPRIRDAVALAAGCAILANSRPFEGLLLCAPLAVAVSYWFLTNQEIGMSRAIRHIVAPAGLLLSFTAIWMGYYNYRCTGHPLVAPYMLHEAQYAASSPFLWQAPRPEPVYHHEVMRESYARYEVSLYEKQRMLGGFLHESAVKIRVLWSFFLGPILTVPFCVGFGGAWKQRWRFAAAATLGIGMLGLLAEKAVVPHYASPLTAIFYFFVADGLRRMASWRWKQKPVGIFVVTLILLASLERFTYRITHFPEPDYYDLHKDFIKVRSDIITQLNNLSGRDLIVVRYLPSHIVFLEWVYNGADIDRSKIAWARDMGPERNRPLLDYFKDRRIWLFEPDRSRALVAYPSGEPGSARGRM